MNPGLSRSPYSLREKLARLLWAMVQATLFRLSFHNSFGWRRALLRVFGATLDPVCRIRRTVRVECPWNLTIGHDSAIGDDVRLYCLGAVRIGNRVTVSQGAHLCAGTHDYTSRSMPLLRLPIEIGDDCWICAGGFVGPGVIVGEGAILGACSVAMAPLDPWTIYAGNPARAMRQRPAFRD